MAKTIYLVKKNPESKKENTEWMQMSGEEFYRFTRSEEGKGRYFIHLTDDVGYEADEIYIEAGYEEFYSWKQEDNRHRYLADCAKDTMIISSDVPVSGGEELLLIDTIQGRPCIAVVNKNDLEQKMDLSYLQEHFSHIISISAYQKTGVDQLSACIHEVLGMMDLDTSAGILANERQRGCAKQALDALQEAQQAYQMGITLDAVGVEVQSALEALMELTGEQVSESVIDEVFSKFCVGK